MRKSGLGLISALGLIAGCTSQQIQSDSEKVIAACQTVLPLAQTALMLPTVGPFVAAGVVAGCGTASGVAKLTSDPSSAEWLAKQEAILKDALR